MVEAAATMATSQGPGKWERGVAAAEGETRGKDGGHISSMAAKAARPQISQKGTTNGRAKDGGAA